MGVFCGGGYRLFRSRNSLGTTVSVARLGNQVAFCAIPRTSGVGVDEVVAVLAYTWNRAAAGQPLADRVIGPALVRYGRRDSGAAVLTLFDKLGYLGFCEIEMVPIVARVFRRDPAEEYEPMRHVIGVAGAAMVQEQERYSLRAARARLRAYKALADRLEEVTLISSLTMEGYYDEEELAAGGGTCHQQ